MTAKSATIISNLHISVIIISIILLDYIKPTDFLFYLFDTRKSHHRQSSYYRVLPFRGRVMFTLLPLQCWANCKSVMRNNEMTRHAHTRAGKKPRFFRKSFQVLGFFLGFLGFLRFFRFFQVFLDLSVQIRLNTKFPPRKNCYGLGL